MSIFLIRHGETALNVARTLQPATTALSARGVAQAGLLARRLATLGLTAIVSSDLPRALQTAEAIGAACGLPVETNALLQERNFGDLRGQPYDALAIHPLTMEEAPPGGESAETFRRRIEAAFAGMVARHGDGAGHLAVVTHRLVIRELARRALRLPAGTVCPESIANTSLSIVDPRAPYLVELLDCTAHLDAATHDNPANLSGG